MNNEEPLLVAVSCYAQQTRLNGELNKQLAKWKVYAVVGFASGFALGGLVCLIF